MTRSKIGPLALEAPLGPKGSQVYRAIHIQQKMQLAVRIFSVPMGMTPEAKQDFTKQMEALKGLRHAGIVRCYGGGFDQRDAYLVYELVDGESLAALLERRQRLPWEVVLDYGLQLCEALQVAHDQKWLHGRIRPDKLLVTRDGKSIKIADFRRETSASNMGFGPSRKGVEMVYSSPEVVGGQGIDVASDLYSLGVALFHMLTGSVPFTASSVDELRQKVEWEVPASVASQIFDCPVWLSSIIEQLLEKSPTNRPFSAAATALALQEAQRRSAQGVSVAQHAVSGFSPLQMKSADRKEAEKVLGTKPKRERRPRGNGPAFYETIWFMVLSLAVIVAGIVYYVMPLSEQQLRSRAEKQLTSNDSYYREDARDRYLVPLVERFPESENADWAREQIDVIEMEIAERQMERRIRFGRDPESETELKYLEASRFEKFGDRVTALEKYQAIVQLLKDRDEKERPFVNLARRQIQRIQERPPSVEELQVFLNGKLEEASELAAKADVIGAKALCDSIISLYNGNQEMKKVVAQAQALLDEMKAK